MSSNIPETKLLQEIEQRAVEMARGAGTILSQHFGRPIAVEYKDKKQSDPVSIADRESQEFLMREIARWFPTHDTLGEEDDKSRDSESQPVPDYIWVLDPLDGTKNFLAGIPTYASSIGILYRGQPVVGAIFLPWPGSAEGVVIHARRGGGAFLDDQPLSSLNLDEPRGNLLAALPQWAWRSFKTDKAIRGKTGEIRVTGSLAYEMALVATGTFQYMITTGPMLWDVAAGAVIVHEVGGATAIASRRRRLAGFQTIEWSVLDRFVSNWEPGQITKKELRNWSTPLLCGSQGVVSALTRHLRFGTIWSPRFGRHHQS